MVTWIFIGSLLFTFVFARVIAHSFHDRLNYGTPYEMSKTVTGWLRKRTGFDLHHYHFGFIIFLFSLIFSYFFEFNTWAIIFLGIGTSLLLDQLIFFVSLDETYFKVGYFGLNSLLISLILHLFVALIVIFFYVG